jgi:hypothetical protein
LTIAGYRSPRLGRCRARLTPAAAGSGLDDFTPCVQPRAGGGCDRGCCQAREKVPGEADRVAVQIGHRGNRYRSGRGGNDGRAAVTGGGDGEQRDQHRRQ